MSLGEVRPDLARIRFGLNQLQVQFVDFALDLMQSIIEEEIVQPIKIQMANVGFSRKIIDDVRAKVKTRTELNTITFLIISDFTTPNGIPVAVIMERGRKSYVVFPKPPTPRRPKPSLKFRSKTGKTVFAKNVVIPRLQGTFIVFRTVRDRRKIVRARFNKEANRFIKEVLLE